MNKVRLRKRNTEDHRDVLIKQQNEEITELKVALKALQVRNKQLEVYVPDEERGTVAGYDFSVRYFADTESSDYHLTITRDCNPGETTTIQLSSDDIHNRNFIIRANAYSLIGHIMNELRKIYSNLEDLVLLELERDVTFHLRAGGVIE